MRIFNPKFKEHTPSTVRHFCQALVQKSEDDSQQGRVVTTVFPEERCPYCKEKP